MNFFEKLRLLFGGGKKRSPVAPPKLGQSQSTKKPPSVVVPPSTSSPRKQTSSPIPSPRTPAPVSAPKVGTVPPTTESTKQTPLTNANGREIGSVAISTAPPATSAPAPNGQIEKAIIGQQRPTAPPPKTAPRGGRTTIIVGLDYGTHSTKILYRKRGEDRARVLQLGAPSVGYPQFAVPSLVLLRDGRLWFGSDALKSGDGSLYRSLKVRLLGPDAERDLEPYPAGPCPDHLVALFLAWTLQRTHEWLSDQFTDPDVRVNLAAPMDHLENETLKIRYLHIVQAAWNLAFGAGAVPVGQGVLLSDVEGRLRQEFDAQVIPAEERKFDVLPETIAPIVSMSLDPRMAPGTHMIVDVGAGTTEISVNYVGERGADHRIRCYRDETILLGGDRLQRIARLSQERQMPARADLVNEFTKAVKRVWAIGYQKDAPSHSARPPWRTLTVLLTGGGGRHESIIQAIHANCPINAWPRADVTYKVSWHTPVNIDLGSHTDAIADLPLLSVACGLTRERETWPTVYEPNHIERMAETEAAARPDGYWYVGGK